MKNIFKYFVNIVAGAYFGLLIMVIANLIISFISHDQAIKNIVRSIACDIGAMVIIFIGFIKKGYDDKNKDNRFISGKTVLFMCSACGLYMLITIIFKYYTGAATNVVYVANVMAGDTSLDIRTMAAKYKEFMFLSLLIQTIPYIPTMIIGYIVGGYKREKDRQKNLG